MAVNDGFRKVRNEDLLVFPDETALDNANAGAEIEQILLHVGADARVGDA